MTLGAALSIALTGLQVNTAQLQLVSNNLANAQQPGYTQKRAIVTSVALGGVVGGATIAGYARTTNDALTNAFNNATADAALLNQQNDYFKQVQTILSSTLDNPPLSDALSKFSSAWTQYAASPETSAQQQSLLQAGTNLASVIRSIASNVSALDRQATTDINSSLSDLNTYLGQVASLNEQIATAGGVGQAVGDLQDQRDQIINQIAAITKVTVVPRANNQVGIYTPQGVLLLDGAPLTFNFNGVDVLSSSGQTVTNQLIGGSVEAQLKFKLNGSPNPVGTGPGDEVIRKLKSQLIAITQAFTTDSAGPPATFANAYNSATTGSGELASDFFTFNIDPNNGLPDPSTLSVNSSLLDGSSKVKIASGTAVTTALSAVRSFSADGLSISAGTYTDLSIAVLSNFQQAANSINAQSLPAQQQRDFYEQTIANATGVNIDNELVALTTLQNSYAASAHVISTIKQMLEDLTNVI